MPSMTAQHGERCEQRCSTSTASALAGPPARDVDGARPTSTTSHRSNTAALASTARICSVFVDNITGRRPRVNVPPEAHARVMSCEICSVPLRPEQIAHADRCGHRARFCSRRCKNTNQNRRRRRITEQRTRILRHVRLTERQLERHRVVNRRAARHRQRAAHPAPPKPPCAWCATKLPSRRRRFCSTACSKRYHHQRHQYPWAKRGSSIICLEDLAERDGWKCHLCKRKVRSLATASRDHLIPMTAGGTNTLANLALAHLTCNAQRQHRGPAQLRLFA